MSQELSISQNMGMDGEPFKSPAPVAGSSNRMRNMNLETAEPVPRFLIIKKIDESDFSKVNPFVIDKIIYGLIGQAKSLRKIKEGLLVETVSSAQSIRLLKVERFGEFSVEVIPHKALNYSKGVITCRDFLNCSVEEISEGLKPAGVIEVRRITTKIDGNIVNTSSLILTFNRPNLPASIKAAFYSLKVRPYIPSPLRCFRCQCFGHTATQCNKTQICVCGLELHEGYPCKTPITCINCGELHSARSKMCSVYKMEQAIQKLKTEERIPYAEARRKIRDSIPNIQTSYSQVLKTQPIKDIRGVIQEMIPEITNICSDIIRNKFPDFIEKTPNISQIASNTSHQIIRSGSISSEKRKRTQDLASNEETSEYEESSSTSTNVFSKGKRRPGRPKKPPG